MLLEAGNGGLKPFRGPLRRVGIYRPRLSGRARESLVTMDGTGERRGADPSKTAETRADLRWAATGGIAAAVIGFAGMAIVGTASSFEARRLLDAVLPTVRFAASAYVAGGATVLALMLTLITFSISHDLEFRVSHYRRIRQIAALTTAVIVGSVILLMFLSFPLGEAEVDRDWHLGVYYAVLLGGAVTGGTFISIMLMLYYAVRELITVGEDPGNAAIVAADATPRVSGTGGSTSLLRPDRSPSGQRQRRQQLVGVGDHAVDAGVDERRP